MKKVFLALAIMSACVQSFASGDGPENSFRTSVSKGESDVRVAVRHSLELILFAKTQSSEQLNKSVAIIVKKNLVSSMASCQKEMSVDKCNKVAADELETSSVESMNRQPERVTEIAQTTIQLSKAIAAASQVAQK